MVAEAHWRDGQRAGRAVKAGGVEEVARQQGLGQRDGGGVLARDTEDLEAVQDFGPGPAMFLCDPGAGQPGLLERLPERGLPGVAGRAGGLGAGGEVRFCVTKLPESVNRC